MTDGQRLRVEPGKPLPLLVRIGRARKPAEATAKRRDGTEGSWRKTLGIDEPGPRDPLGDDAPGWRSWP